MTKVVKRTFDVTIIAVVAGGLLWLALGAASGNNGGFSEAEPAPGYLASTSTAD